MDKEMLRSKEASKTTLIGFFVNMVLVAFKLTAGILGRSGAMIADAVHSLSDILTDIVVLIGMKLTAKPADECHNYGHGKYETIAAVAISLMLALAGYQILKYGIVNISNAIKGDILPKPGLIALIAAAISIVSKEILYRYTILVGKKINSSAVIANAWHHRSDAFSSIGTMIGIGGAIFLGKKWTILDPIASVIVSLFIFKVAYDILIPSFNELVEKSLSIEERKQIDSVLQEMDSVLDYHKFRMRRVGNKIIIEGHIQVNNQLNIRQAHAIAAEAERRIKALFAEKAVVTIHIEPYYPEQEAD